MNNIELIDNTIVITEYSYKMALLKQLNCKQNLFNVKFMTMKELIEKIYFTYDEKAIYYLMKKYFFKREIAEMYINNLYFLNYNDNYTNEKVLFHLNLRKELDENNLLYYDNYFSDYIKNKSIVFFNYNYFNKFEKEMIKKLETITNVNIIAKNYKKYDPVVYEFDDIFDEVEFVATEILKLVEGGVSLSNIKLTNINDDYIDVLNMIFSMFGLDTSVSKDKIISTKVANDFFMETGCIKERIIKLKNIYKNNDILNKIINIVNKYVCFDDEDIVLEMVKYDLKNSYISYPKKANFIEIIDYKNYFFTDEDYVFMLNFNQNSIPIVYKDEDYFSDDLKDCLLIDTTLVKNKNERQASVDNILNIKNLVITYKNKTSFSVFYPSNLISDLNMKVIKKYKNQDIYSKQYAKISLAKKLDNYVLYGTVNDELKKLYTTFLNFPYNKYDNKYKKIDKESFLDYVKDGFNLSYSNMSDYYKCSFKYYLSNVLKLNIYEDSFDTYIGSLFHYVLENGLKYDKNVEILITDFIEKNERKLSKKEQFFIKKLTNDIIFAFNTIKDNLKKTDLRKMLFEERVEVIKNKDVTITFKGFIDKIMYDSFDNNTIVCIIDYKTGYTDIDLKYVPFGLSLQLPVYLYLAKNSQKLENIKFGGFYLQRVLNSIPVIDSKKDIGDIKKEGLLLYGFSNDNKEILEKVDNTYKNSTVIKSMKLGSNGEFSRYSKVLNDAQINKLIKITDEKINEAIEGILNTKFDINPKVTDKDNLGCKYCKYHDICFVERNDEVVIIPDNDLSFLGGDENA